MANTMHQRLDVLRYSIENSLKHAGDGTNIDPLHPESDPMYCFGLDVCHDLLFNTDYSQSSSLLLGKHLRQCYRTITRQTLRGLPAPLHASFEAVRHSLMCTIPLSSEEHEKLKEEARQELEDVRNKYGNKEG